MRRNYPALRLGAQAFLFSAVLSFFTRFRPDLPCLALTSALVLVAALAAVRIENRGLRLVLGLVPFAALLMPISNRICFPAAGIATYGAIVLTRGDFCPEPVVYRSEAKWILGTVGVLMIVAISDSFGTATVCLLLCSAFLVLLTLQSLLVSAFMGPSWQFGTVGVLLLVLGLGLGLGVLFRAVVVPCFVKLIESLFYVLFYLLSGLFDWILRIINSVQPYPWDPNDTGLPSLDLGTENQPKSGIPASPKEASNFRMPEIPWMELLAALTVLLFILLAIRLIRNGGLSRLRHYRLAQANETETLEKRGSRGKKKQESKSNRDRVRFLYGRYLDYLRMHGLKLETSETTAEITIASSEVLMQSDELLRSLYRKARYSNEDIDDAEVQAAEDLFKQLVAYENLRDK